MPLPEPMEASAPLIGWDIGGAHLKACLVERGADSAVVIDAAQWPCPLWQGLDHLRAALASARAHWPQIFERPDARHAVTMTGEMVDRFADRQAGVHVLVAEMAAALGPSACLRLFAGAADIDDARRAAARWCDPHEADARWRDIASANWQATALLAARRVEAGDGVLVDIGSTTTDIVALRDGAPVMMGRDDSQRLASGELVYHGVVRTPLCALAPRIGFQGRPRNVMNEWFATSADVYRLTGELDPAHDVQPSADGAPKDAPATRRRLARMIGLDARDASDADWLALAHAWRSAQLATLRGELERVIAATGVASQAPLVAAGCGDFLVSALASELGRACTSFAALALRAGEAATRRRALSRGRIGSTPSPTLTPAPDAQPTVSDAEALARRIQVAAPAAAVALLLHEWPQAA